MNPPKQRAARSGAHRSLEILQELAEARIRGVGSARASRTVSELDWRRAQSDAIQIDNQPNGFRTVWHAGHITAILTNNVDVIAATQTGGVWLLHSIPGPTPLAGYTGSCLSLDWDAPDIGCLAWAPGEKQVFVGTSARAMFLLDFDTEISGRLSWQRTTTLPTPFSAAVSIVTFDNPARIVVATDNGIWWSPIPQPATNAGGYMWQEGEGSPTVRYSGMAAGPDSTVAAVTFGRQLFLGAAAGVTIYRGSFQGNTLVFTESQIHGADPQKMRRTSMASCADQPARMYTVSADNDGKIVAVLSSSDGGATWAAGPTPNKATSGERGFYNNCIAVSPTRPHVVVIGWMSAGPFWSDDGGQTWQQRHSDGAGPHLHADLHALCLSRNASGPETLLVGGDGGIAVSHDSGATYHSHFNRPLSNLQFYGGGRETFMKTKGGTLTASSRYPGLLAGGLQDNGNVYRCPDKHRGAAAPRQADTPWLKQVGGDGDINRFIDPLGALLSFNNNDKFGLQVTVWDEVAGRFPPGYGAVIPADGNAAGILFPTAVDVVQEPSFRKGAQLMYAATGSTGEGLIHGFFADTPKKDVPEATNAQLLRLGFVGGSVSAIASRDGHTLMVGTEDGRIVSFDCASGSVTPFALPDVVGDNVVHRIELFLSPFAAGALPDHAFALVGGRIVYFNGLFWSTTTGTDWVSLAYDAPSGRLFAATDSDVFVSEDRAKTWVDASLGLPTRPHCCDLKIAADLDGGRDLYLSTYGSSVWRAAIAQRSQILELPPEANEILVGVIEDGGGLVRRGKRFIKLPPRPLLRDLLAALEVDEAAQAMSKGSEENARAIRRSAMRQIAKIAVRELKRLR